MFNNPLNTEPLFIRQLQNI